MIDLHRYWWPVATLDALTMDRPLARMLHSTPVVVFRDRSGAPATLLDRCPHRHAPLSAGKVENGEVECPYHGWRFDGAGHCTRVPGLGCERSNKPLVAPLPTRVAHDMIWVCLAPNADTPEPAEPAPTEGRVDTFFMTDRVGCTLAQAAENFLDGFHTHFVHAGWIRRDGPRQSVQARVRRLPDGVQAHYSGEGTQSGWISRLLEGDREQSMGRFRLPCMAEIEYRSPKGLTLLITAWLTPETDTQLRIHARIATRRGWLPAGLKKFLLQRVFQPVLRQDKMILERVHDNTTRFAACTHQGAHAPPLDSPLDLLGPCIQKLLDGKALGERDEKELRVDL